MQIDQPKPKRKNEPPVSLYGMTLEEIVQRVSKPKARKLATPTALKTAKPKS